MVDAHIHISQTGEWFTRQYNASYVALMDQMDAGGVTKGLLLGLAQLDQNDYLKKVCEESNGRLFALAAFDPTRQLVEDVAPYLDCGLFRGVKLHPRRENFSPLDERLFPLYEVIAKRGSVINFDVFGHSAYLPMDQLRPTVFDRLAKKFPELKMVLSHCCTPWVMEAFFAAKSNPNVYLDCSFIIERFRGSSVTMDLLYTARHLDQKLLFGSDFPEEQVNRYLSLARVEFKDLAEEKKANIFGLNAVKVYGL
ncbi:MAG: amidohydrolase [Nitrospinae bacterium]|nr:amidohydrolase [Nitrospinota bacterium]